jgi:hypothetical protein
MESQTPQKPKANHFSDLQEREEFIKNLIKRRDSVFARFPLLFTLLGTFGLICTFYGLQHILEKIPLIANDPFIALAVGLVILVATGKLYKKLG